MTNTGKPLMNVLGWVLAVWGLLTILTDILVLTGFVAADAYWMQFFFGTFQLIAVSLVLGVAETAAGILAIKWAGQPDKAMSLFYLGCVLALFFAMEAFFTYTQLRMVWWGHLILGLAVSGLTMYAAWQSRD